MGRSSDSNDGYISRNEDSGRIEPKTSIRDILDAFEKLGEKDIQASELAEELDYSRDGALKRLKREDEYVERKDLGQGNPILWSLKYTRRDFLNVFDELGDLIPTEKIVDYLGCPEETAREWLYKLEDEGEIASHTRGEDISPLWSKLE